MKQQSHGICVQEDKMGERHLSQVFRPCVSTYERTHARTHTHTNARTHAHARTRTLARTHTHTGQTKKKKDGGNQKKKKKKRGKRKKNAGPVSGLPSLCKHL